MNIKKLIQINTLLCAIIFTAFFPGKNYVLET